MESSERTLNSKISEINKAVFRRKFLTLKCHHYFKKKGENKMKQNRTKYLSKKERNSKINQNKPGRGSERLKM